MKLRQLLFLLLISLLVIAGCKKDDNPAAVTTPINEAQVLAEYLEANGDYMNTSAPSIVAASAVYTDLNANPPTEYIIDLRSSTDFQAGHIAGAHNVALGDLLTHVRGVSNISSFNRVVIVCYSGQTSAYGTALLRLMGYSNAISMKWGMSSWDSTFALTKWYANISNSRASQFVTTATAKGQAGNLPTLATGKTTGAEILEARVVNALAAGFTPATVSNSTVFGNPSGYYIVNYWPVTEYNDPGHIPGAVQYTPRSDLRLASALKTLPTTIPVVVYCYTGQTSAFITAYLRLLGYDAKSLLWGANGMIYDVMVTRSMATFKAAEIMGYPYVTGP
jgi:rhodanese-related sulfurtransferase